MDGLRKDELYREAVEVLSKAELFLYSILPDEEVLFQKLYDTAVNEAHKRENVDDERTLLASKSFSHWGWFSSDGQTWGHSLQAGYTDPADCPAKLACYHGIHQILCGELEEGMSSLKSSLDRLGSSCDEKVLKLLAYQVLAFSHWRKEEHKMASDFVDLCRIEAKAGLACVGMPFSFSLNDASVQHDGFLFSVSSNLILLSVRRKNIASLNYHAMAAALRGRYEYFSNARFKQFSTILTMGIGELKEPELITDEFEVAVGSLYFFVDFIDQLSQGSLITLQTANQFAEQALHFLENSSSVNYFVAFYKQPIKEMGNILKSIENDLDLDFEEFSKRLRHSWQVSAPYTERLQWCHRVTSTGHKNQRETHWRPCRHSIKSDKHWLCVFQDEQ
ncbi:hypothetical protein OS493_011641 [Desmophyllum pertusum]|uniref:Uncharacterized protein n=1 Tax=Desmophyllum pertusum TaxID=174260 RepID=A0A9X0CMZ3_9CNID|nr:hypothetical protein OS493_011641 [Desmophyllum pertusum]